MSSRAKNVLVLDHFDSFTWNIVHGLSEAGGEVQVLRVDATCLEEIQERNPDLLVLSPGPGRPEEAALALNLLRQDPLPWPVLGICLGHQVMALAFGGRVERNLEPIHGKSSKVHHDGRGLFRALSNPMVAGRYHSLVVTDPPPGWKVSAWLESGQVMGLRHPSLPIEGVQFHPDSFLTPEGAQIWKNVLDI